MKKILLFAMVLFFGLANPLRAENTDISTLENVVYIEPFSMAAGSQHTLSVKMKNAVAVEGFGFDLYLPDGVSVATDGDGFPMVELSTERTTAKKTNSFDAAFQTDGCLRVLAASTNASTISGNDGEVVLITIKAETGMSVGNYSVMLKNIAISDTEAKSHRTDYVETTVTITAPADARTVLNETSTVMPETATDVNVRVRRTIKAGEWSTLCLPFAMSEAQVKTAFGDEVQLADFQGYDVKDDGESISVKFADVTAIEKNHPYIIKVGADVTEFTVDGVDVDPEEEPMINFGTKRKPKAFIGNYVAGTAIDNGCLFLSDNKFWYSVGTTTIKGFRGYFNFDDLLPDFEDNYAAARVMMMFNDDDVVTGIDASLSSKGEHRYYNLGGQRISHPKKKGLYIQEGKKLIVK